MGMTTEELRKQFEGSYSFGESAESSGQAQSSLMPPDDYVDPKLQSLRDEFAGQYTRGQQAQPEERDYGFGITTAFMRGLERLRAMPDIAQGDTEELAQHMTAIEQYKMADEDVAKMEEIRNTEGNWAKIGQLAQNPRLVMQVVAESLPMMAAPIVGAVGGGIAGGAAGTAIAGPPGTATGGVAGTFVGGGIGSYMTEYFASLGEAFQEAGIDMKNPAAIKAAFEDPAFMELARKKGHLRSIPISIMDAASMGLAGRIAKPVASLFNKMGLGKFAGGVAGGTAEIGMQAGLGSAGEAGAQLMSEGEISEPLDVILEGVAEIVPGTVEAGVSGYLDRRNTRLGRDVKKEDSPLAALGSAAPVDTPVDTPTPPPSGPTIEDELDKLSRQLHEDLGEKQWEFKDPLDTLLEQLGVELEQDLSEANWREQQAAQQAKQREDDFAAMEVQRRQKEELGMLAQAAADAVTQAEAGPNESRMATPRGQEIPEGELIDVIGGQPTEAIRVTDEELINPAGGRPQNTAMADAMKQAGIVRPNRPSEPPPGGGPGAGVRPPAPLPPDAVDFVAPDVRPKPSAKDIQAAENLQYDTEDLEERAAIRAESEMPVEDVGPPEREIPFKPLGQGAPTPAVEWADERLANREAHGALDFMMQDIQPGGGITLVPSEELGVQFDRRTPSTNPSWFQSIVEDEKVGMKTIQTAIDKAKEGKRLGAKQKRIVQRILDEYEGLAEEQERMDEAAPGSIAGEAKAAASFTDVFGAPSAAQQEIADRERKRAEKERKAPAADTGKLDDIFTAKQTQQQAAGQTDIEDEVSDLDAGIPKGTVEQLPPTLYSSLPKTEKKVVGDFHAKMYGEKSRGLDIEETVAGEPDKRGKPRLANRGKQVILDAYNDAQTGAQPAEKYLQEFRDAIAYAKEKGGYKEGMLGSRHDYLEARNVFEGNKKREVSWENVSAVVKKLGIDLTPAKPKAKSNFTVNEENFDRMGPDTEERVFKSTVNSKTRKAIDTKLKGTPYISMEEADKVVTEWEDHAIAQSKESGGPQNHKDNFNRVIISLFDTTGTWANPYALAGYDVRALDIKDGIDITDFSTEFMDEMFNNFEGKEIYGILAACPCTTFSNSGTRWRKDRHENADPVESRKIIEQMWGKEAAEAVDPETGEYTYATAHDYAIALVDKTMQTLEYLRPKFWALENPEGRIETSAGLPGPWRTGFQPHNFGEPYTKRTLLWGEFNENLPTANVEPTEGSKMHKMSPSETRQAERSETPAGFSYAFFMANNYLDKSPLERTKADYWYVEGAIEEAFKAGVTEDEIRANIELDQSYEPADIEGTLEAIRELINKKPPSTPGTPTTPPSDKGGPKRGFGPAWGIPDEAEIDAAANEAAPDEATDAQKEAGNYKKGHISIAGFDVTIENPAGTVRHGNLKLRDHYGYIKRTKGADSGQIDVFVNSKAAEDFTGDIYVVDQIDPKTGKFDEHKVMLGYNNQLDARRAYKRNYNKDWKGAGNIVKMTLEEFKAWLDLPGVNDQPARYAPTGPDSPAFKEWFGNSKVVDKKGKPIVVYHGTQSKEEFNIFEPKASFGGWNNVGTWFSDTPKHAEVFTWISRQDGKSGQMIPAYVRIEKPWIVEWDRLQEKIEEVIARHNAKTGEKLDRYGGKELKQRVTSKVGLVLRKALQDQGYDGLILENWTGDGPPAQNVYVAFEPEQIKSAIGNRGTYDIMNKDIRYASGRELTGAPTKQWLEKVLAGGEKRMGDLPDTVPLNVAVSELLKLQQQRQALDAGQPVPVTPVRPTLQEVQKAIAPVEKAMPGAPVEVLANYKQAPKLVRDRMSADGMTQVRAVFDPQTGKIYLFADQARDANDAVMTALHEKAHLGLRKAFGDRLNPLLDDIFMNVSERRRADMQKIADQYRLDVGKLDDRRTIAEELLAHMAEHDVKDGIVNRAIAFIRKALRSMGFTQKFSDNDIRALIREAQGSITRGPSRTAGITLEEEVVLDETGEVFIVEREADQILTGLDQRIMICERIRDCV